MNPAREIKKIAIELEEMEKEAQGGSLVEIVRAMAEEITKSLETDAKIDNIAPGKIIDALKDLDLDQTGKGRELIKIFEELG